MVLGERFCNFDALRNAKAIRQVVNIEKRAPSRPRDMCDSVATILLEIRAE